MPKILHIELVLQFVNSAVASSTSKSSGNGIGLSCQEAKKSFLHLIFPSFLPPTTQPSPFHTFYQFTGTHFRSLWSSKEDLCCPTPSRKSCDKSAAIVSFDAKRIPLIHSEALFHSRKSAQPRDVVWMPATLWRLKLLPSYIH